MNTELVEKYQLKYIMLVKEFVKEVESGCPFPELKVIMNEMKVIGISLEHLLEETRSVAA